MARMAGHAHKPPAQGLRDLDQMDHLRLSSPLRDKSGNRATVVSIGGKLAGIVSIGDVVKHRLEDLELETNVLRDVYNAAR